MKSFGSADFDGLFVRMYNLVDGKINDLLKVGMLVR